MISRGQPRFGTACLGTAWLVLTVQSLKKPENQVNKGTNASGPTPVEVTMQHVYQGARAWCAGQVAQVLRVLAAAPEQERGEGGGRGSLGDAWPYA